MSAPEHYDTDLTDEQWELIQSVLPEAKWKPGGSGRPPVEVRQALNGILYLNKTGCQWRLIPKEFGHWSTIYGYFKCWRRDGIWARLMEALRQLERRLQGRHPEPSASSIDSQSIKTATQHEDIGYDGNKKIKGCKRHILVDTLRLIIGGVVTDAGTNDRWGLVNLLTEYFADGVKRLRKLWVDGAYPTEWLEAWVRGLKQTHKIDLESTNQEGKGFQVIPWRWAVDVSFHEDACRIRNDQGTQTFSVLHHIALNLLKRESQHKRGIKARCKRAGWDRDYLLQVLTG